MRFRHAAAPVLFGIVLAWVLTVTALGAPMPEDDAIRKLAEAKLEAAKAAYEACVEEEAGAVSLQRHDWSKRWLDAELEVARDRKARVAAFQGHLERMSELKETAKAEMDRFPGRPRQRKLIYAAYYRAESELWLANEKAK